MTRFRALVLGAAALALLGACGQAAEAGSPRPAGQEVVAPQLGEVDKVAGDAALLATAVVPQLGTVLTDGKGLTLYRFDKDTASPSVSDCDGECAEKWPPVLASTADLEVQGVDAALVSTVDRKDGAKQITVAGWPVYRFAQDAEPGQAKGQGVGGTWFVAAPDGKKAAPASSGLALTTASVGNLGTVLTDKEGMTLYRFDKDATNPSVSNCNGECAVKWPPLLVGSEDFEVQGVDKSLVGTVVRVDGQQQVTVAGWPLYLFAEDELCGEAKGQGVGGVWFAAKPDGKKAGV
ncbi:hypothetical protein ABZ816_08565 [Actinosynnema sp. NPDC047251]|uniref:Lipoprotein n=1 Tax=Saccharothrix espanaensis (strain ATCC 51144 / DSM 44229 / JCM 9112 / NBRC 15066 / NRRL 15764) TaxID=1179773 RepID=K0KB55_SACES|nr:lipoprotein [Saccharothrix espanaensis]CCH33863.1 Lipoprotein [Saccharothrix espanaensis DSM 44229]